MVPPDYNDSSILSPEKPTHFVIPRSAALKWVNKVISYFFSVLYQISFVYAFLLSASNEKI